MTHRFTQKIITAFDQMIIDGHIMESGEIELKNGTKFSYKLKVLKK
jgi:hypothetical protein